MALPRIRGLRWWMISLLMLGAILNYLTRNTLSITYAASPMKADLHMTDRDYSWVVNAFQGTLMLQPACGYLLDLIGLKAGMAIFVGSWSLITMAHGLVGSWLALLGLRGLLGLCEGSSNPAGMKATAEWFPARERGHAGGVYNIGASVGSMVAPLLVGWAIAAHDWHFAFYIVGALGAGWFLLWLLFYHAPAKHPSMTEEERAYIAAGQETHLRGDEQRPPILSILRRRNFWGIALPRFLADPTWGTLAFWMPAYLTNVRHFDLKGIQAYSWLPFLAADLGCLFGPTIATLLHRRGVTLVNARRGAFTVGAFLMTGVMFVGYAGSPYLAVALLCLAGFSHQTLSVTVITMSSDLFKRSEVATVAGLAGTMGNLGIAVFNTFIGGYVATIGYTPFFVCLGILDLIGAIVLWTVVREPVRSATVAAV